MSVGLTEAIQKRYKNQNILIPALIQLDGDCKHNSITRTNLLTFIYNLIRIKTNYKDNNNNNNIAERNQYQISSCKHR